MTRQNILTSFEWDHKKYVLLQIKVWELARKNSPDCKALANAKLRQKTFFAFFKFLELYFCPDWHSPSCQQDFTWYPQSSQSWIQVKDIYLGKYGTRSYKDRLKHKLVKNLRIQSDTQKIFIGMVSGLISKRKFTPHNITVPVLASYLALCFGQKIEHPIRLKNECGVNLRLNVFIRSAPDLKQLTQLEKAELHPFITSNFVSLPIKLKRIWLFSFV